MAATAKTATSNCSGRQTFALSKVGTFVTVEDGLVQIADVAANQWRGSRDRCCVDATCSALINVFNRSHEKQAR
jgi:hypothetical protein